MSAGARSLFRERYAAFLLDRDGPPPDFDRRAAYFRRMKDRLESAASPARGPSSREWLWGLAAKRLEEGTASIPGRTAGDLFDLHAQTALDSQRELLQLAAEVLGSSWERSPIGRSGAPRILGGARVVARASRAVVLCAALLRATPDLDVRDTSLLSTLETLLDQLLVDLVGHLRFLQSQLGRASLQASRPLVRGWKAVGLDPGVRVLALELCRSGRLGAVTPYDHPLDPCVPRRLPG